jgi:hypothetical protein
VVSIISATLFNCILHCFFLSHCSVLVNEILHFLCLTRMMFPRDTPNLVLANQELDWNMTMVAVLHSMVTLTVIG